MGGCCVKDSKKRHHQGINNIKNKKYVFISHIYFLIVLK